MQSMRTDPIARLDRLPVWPYPYRALVAVGAGFFFALFDVVTIGDALPYLADPRRALDEASRVMRRGSRIAVSVLDRALSTPAQKVFHEQLLALERRHPIVVPRPPGDRLVPRLSRPRRSGGVRDVQVDLRGPGVLPA